MYAFITHTDVDGWCSAAVLLQYFQCDDPKANIHYHSYGRVLPFEKFTGMDVFVTDLSLSMQEVDSLCAVARKVVWIDHHPQSGEYAYKAREKHKNLVVLWNTNRCGAWLAYQYVHDSHVIPPRIIRQVDDYDRWIHAYPDTKANHLALELLSYKDKSMWSGWGALLDGDALAMSMITNLGKSLLDAQNVRVKALLYKGIPGELFGHSTLFVNTSIDINELADCMSDKYALLCAWHLTNQDNECTVMYSIRTRKEGIDVGQLCSTMGGGGHKKAAGWTTKYASGIKAFTLLRFADNA